MALEASASAVRPRAHLNFKLNPAFFGAYEEAISLLDLKGGTRAVRPGQEIISEGRRCTSLFIVVEGLALRYRVLRDGQRVVLNLVLPGDFVGMPSCFFETALYSTRTLTQSVVAPLPLPRLLSLMETHPRAAARLLSAFSCEAAVFAERLINVSRRSATERIAHFLLELHTRLRRIGLADEQSFRVPLTQEMLSDALGLSIPYVNRVLHQLRDEGLVHIKDQHVVIDDMDELSARADFEEAYLTPLSITDFRAELA